MNWHSWLFVVCFIAVTAVGLRLSWLWCYRPRYERWRQRSRSAAKPGKFGRSKRHLYYIPHK